METRANLSETESDRLNLDQIIDNTVLFPLIAKCDRLFNCYLRELKLFDLQAGFDNATA